MRNPRIAITLKPDDYKIISDLANVTNQPMSKVISEMLELALPYLNLLLKDLEKVNKLRSDVKHELACELDGALKSNREALEMLFDLLNDATDRPPSSNTGVTPL